MMMMTAPPAVESAPAAETALFTSKDDDDDHHDRDEDTSSGGNDDDDPDMSFSGQSTILPQDAKVVPTQSGYDRLKNKRDVERLRMFRVLVGGMLVMTGVVTGIAYYLLGQQEQDNFETAVRSFVCWCISYVWFCSV